jgi:hypothetical protein
MEWWAEVFLTTRYGGVRIEYEFRINRAWFLWISAGERIGGWVGKGYLGELTKGNIGKASATGEIKADLKVPLVLFSGRLPSASALLPCSAKGLGRGGPMRRAKHGAGPARLRVATHYCPAWRKTFPMILKLL